MKNSSFLRRFLPKLDNLLGISFIAAVFCQIFILAHNSVADLDIWLHLKAGEFIWRSGGIVPVKDIFSFTMPVKPWVDHEWLFQVLNYLIYNKWGADGLISLETIVIIAIFFILSLAAIKSANPYLETGALIFVTAFASISRFNIRPDIFSLFFFVLYLYLLRYQTNTWKIWLVIPLGILWVNIHGYFFLGPLLIFMFILAEFARRNIAWLPRGQKKEFALQRFAYIRLQKVFLFSVSACFFNPYAARGALYPLFVLKEMLSGRMQVFFKHIQELQPTFTLSKGSVPGEFYAGLIIACFILMLVNFKKLKIIEEMLFIFFFLFTLTLRNVAFFSAVCFMIIISYFVPTLARLTARRLFRAPSISKPIAHLIRCIISVVLIILVAQKVNAGLKSIYYDFSGNKIKDTVSDVDARGYPGKAADFVLKNNLPKRMFNDFNSGAYLIGRGYPERKVFIDGRTEFYGPDFFKEQQKMLEGDKTAFLKIAAKYNLEAFLLSYARTALPPIIKHIYNDPEWKLVFLDEAAVIFLKRTPANAALIKQYQIDLNKYSAPPPDLMEMGLIGVYPTPYITRASLFNLLGKDALVISEAKEALRVMPDCFKAYQLMGKVYLRQGQYQKALENFRSALLILPQDAETLVELGKCLIKLKENTFALRTLKGAVRLYPRYAPAYCQLGVVYLMQHNEEEAIRAFKKAVMCDPKEPLFHFNLGKAFYSNWKITKDRTYIAKAGDEFKMAAQLNLQLR